jgi:Endonuclease/Exonuclease/phosphatase family
MVTLTLTMINNSNTTQTRLRIWQQNVGKSITSIQHLLNSDLHDHYDILALQEPYLDHLGNTRASHKWRALYPTIKADGRHPYRTAILINNSISTNLCRPRPFPSPDVTVIHLAFPNNPITIFNIYNDGEHDHTIDKLLTYRAENLDTLYPVPQAHILWLGDFNRHHPTWDHARNHRYFTVAALRAAEHLLTATADWNLHMALLSNTPTHEHYVSKQQSRLNNVFCTDHTLNLINICEVLLDDPKPGTDHYPIISIIDLPVHHQETPSHPDFRMADWETFNSNLSAQLTNFPPPAPLACKTDFNRASANLTEAIQGAIHTTIPIQRPCPHTKRWWTLDLKKMRQTMRPILTSPESTRISRPPNSQGSPKLPNMIQYGTRQSAQTALDRLARERNNN